MDRRDRYQLADRSPYRSRSALAVSTAVADAGPASSAFATPASGPPAFERSPRVRGESIYFEGSPIETIDQFDCLRPARPGESTSTMHRADDADGTELTAVPTDASRVDADTARSEGFDESLTIAYVRHRRINEMIDVIRYCLESQSIGFDRWGEEHIKGPGFYLAIVSGSSVEGYADRMGTNCWPTDVCRTVTEDVDRFYKAASRVAHSSDGAVIASIDGVVQRQMVRLKHLSHTELEARVGESIPYADWMGSRHMNALDTSAREDVIATVTLSEESGRVTAFSNGTFESVERGEIGGRWRVGDGSTTADR
jgi:hypothetical protein